MARIHQSSAPFDRLRIADFFACGAGIGTAEGMTTRYRLGRDGLGVGSSIQFRLGRKSSLSRGNRNFMERDDGVKDGAAKILAAVRSVERIFRKKMATRLGARFPLGFGLFLHLL